ncbi:MAG TPA: folate-binding protein YgfZ [Zetaproteobacteria bacterium]|nr:folate-binding protein YgfZ [Zetaproteobacteria bacterium]
MNHHAQTGAPALTPQTAETLLLNHIVSESTCWSVLKASGQGLREYLQGQITQDIARLKPEQGIHACLLSPQGKAVSELYILQAAGDELILLTPSYVATETVARLRRFALGYQMRIGIMDAYAVYSVQGTGATRALADIGLPEPGETWRSRSRHPDEDVFALLMPKQPPGYWIIGRHDWLAQRLSDRVSEDQCEALRIIRGLPRFGSEWDVSLHPLNANLIEFDGVSFDKGCYVGQEVTGRMHWRGGIKKKLYRVLLPDMQAEHPPQTLPCPVVSTGRIGELRSMAFDQDRQCFGIALLPISTVQEDMPLHLENGSVIRVLEPCHA